MTAAIIQYKPLPVEPARPIVYVVDDDTEFLDSCRYLLESEKFKVRTFNSGLEFLDDFEQGPTCCLLLDVVMPQIDGLGVLEKIQENGWIVPTIVMTAYGRVQQAVQAMKLGAVDFIEKPFESTQAMIDLVRQSLELQSHQQQARDDIDSIERRIRTLTPREVEVMEAVVGGFSNPEICTKLGTQLRTVETQRALMMEKMNAHSVAHLVRMVLKVRLGGNSHCRAHPHHPCQSRRRKSPRVEESGFERVILVLSSRNLLTT